jgi:NAD(P)-dependent dehydrogenase (short-subunit alcohol dehydrogenase family)
MRVRSTSRTRAEPTARGPETHCYVLGGSRLGVAVARRLHAAGHDVTLADAEAGHEPIRATTVLADGVVDGVAPRLGEVDG